MARIEYPVAFIRDDGITWIARTPAEAAGLAFGRHHRKVTRHRDYDGSVLGEFVVESEWIARDAFGDIVEPSDVPDRPRLRRSWSERRLDAIRAAQERDLPIPKTGRKRARKFKKDRKRLPRSRGEARSLADLVELLEEANLHGMIRPERRRLGPGPYEPRHRRDTERNWKNQRRTQWRKG